MSQPKAAEDMFAARTRLLEIAARDFPLAFERATLPAERKKGRGEGKKLRFSLGILLMRAWRRRDARDDASETARRRRLADLA